MKSKSYTIIAVIATSIALAVAFCTCSGNDKAKQYDITDPMILRELDIISCDEMSIEQLRHYKIECETSISRINSKLSSDSLNPEDIHKLLIERQNIKCELESIHKYLPE